MINRMTITCARRMAWTFQHLGTAQPPWICQWGQICLKDFIGIKTNEFSEH